MNIKSAIYKELSNSQRAKVLYDSILRGDTAEATRLMECCEKKIYKQPHHEFVDAIIEHIVDSSGLPEDKIKAMRSIFTLARGKDAESDTENITIAFVHKRSADWPPEDIPDDHIISDEFIPTRNVKGNKA